METNHKSILQKAYLFQGMSDSDYAVLINYFSPQIKHFSKNETIFFTGDSIHHIGIILRGTAHAYLEHINGNRTTMSILTPLKVFGELIAGAGTHQSPVTICAASPVTAAFIEYDKIFSVCAAACPAHMIFMQNMIKVIGDKYFYLFDRINILREKMLRSKIMAYLYELSDNGKNTIVTLPFSKTMLADYLLANRSALSKELRQMERDGIIILNGRNITLLYLLS